MRYLILTAAALLISACDSGAQMDTGNFQFVSTVQAQQTLSADQTIVPLDIRTPKEVAKGMIPGARHIDYHDKDFKDQLSALERDKTYLVYCHSGGRSNKSLSILSELGFTSVIHLDNGMKGWKEKGFPVSLPN